jgi:hypothetical protein
MIIVFLLFSHNEKFINVDGNKNAEVINSLVAPIQTNFSTLISKINETNDLIKSVNFSTVPSSGVVNNLDLNKTNLGTYITNLNNNFVNLNNQLNNIINVDILVKFLNQNKPTHFYLPTIRNKNNLVNIVTGLPDCVTSGSAPTFSTIGGLQSLSGNGNTIVSWPENILTSNHTLIGISKYTGGLNGRVLDSTNNKNNALYGHWSGKAGLVHINHWNTKSNEGILSGNNINNWLVTCVRAFNQGKATANTNRANDVILNNIKLSNGNVPKTISNVNNLVINGREKSNFASLWRRKPPFYLFLPFCC